jgi:deoxyhypusine synthase
VLVTTVGGIEKDLIKCLAPTYMGDFGMQGVELRSKGFNRIGNLLIPNDNYCKFEDWVVPILDQLQLEQRERFVGVIFVDNCKRHALLLPMFNFTFLK